MPGATVDAAEVQMWLFEPEGPDMGKLKRERERLAAGAKHAPATRRAYESGWRDFQAWCERAGRRAMPAAAETVELYLTDLARTRKVATLEARVAAIAARHKAVGAPAPCGPGVRGLIRAAAREKGRKPDCKAALTADQVRAIAGKFGKRPQDVRDKAMLLLGFATGLRRGELAGLRLEDVSYGGHGLVVTVRRGKTDQAGRGREIGVFRGRRAATCPVRAVERYVKRRGKWAGPLFVAATVGGELTRAGISGRVVASQVKRWVRGIGLDPRRYGGHSLRAGMITAAAEAGTPETLIAQRSGHRSLEVLARYVRPVSVWTHNPMARAL